jgi:RNA polymerase sigma factor FliA
MCLQWQRERHPKMATEIIQRIRPSVMKLAMNRAKLWTGGMIDVSDLVSVGLFAVYESIDRFDATKMTRFSTFVMRRVNGAMSDEMRNADPLSRTMRRRLKASGGRFNIRSISSGEDEKKAIQISVECDAPYEPLARRQQFEAMLAGLDSNERLIARMRFVDDLCMKDIGRAIGLSESRISQMLSSILARIKSRIVTA